MLDNVGIRDSACVGYKLICEVKFFLWSEVFEEIRITDVRSARDKIGSISQYPIGFSLRDILTCVLAMSPTGHVHDEYKYHDSLCASLIRGITHSVYHADSRTSTSLLQLAQKLAQKASPNSGFHPVQLFYKVKHNIQGLWRARLGKIYHDQVCC